MTNPLLAVKTMDVTSYMIMVEPDSSPKFYRLDADGLRRTLISDEAVPEEVVKHAGWLVALVEGRPMPPDPPPPAVLGDVRHSKRLFAFVTCK